MVWLFIKYLFSYHPTLDQYYQEHWAYNLQIEYESISNLQ